MNSINNATPFSLRIFVADGDPDGLRLVERSNWIGKAVMFPRAFEQSPTIKKGVNPPLHCRGKGIVATARDTAQGFVVQSGSFAAKDHTPSLEQYSPSVCDLRARLLKSGVLGDAGDRLRFTQDYTFSSPSLAAAVVLGRQSNGRTEWKDANGKTLKELQESQSEK